MDRYHLYTRQEALENPPSFVADFLRLNHDDFKAEFFDGRTYVYNPSSYRNIVVSQRIGFLLGRYAEEETGGVVAFSKLIVQMNTGYFRPELSYFTKHQWNSFDADQFLFPSPKLILEVDCADTKSINRGIKFREYALGGVEEYWIVDAERQVLEQYVNVEGAFDLVKAHLGSGQVYCRAVEGFVLALRQVFAE